MLVLDVVCVPVVVLHHNRLVTVVVVACAQAKDFLQTLHSKQTESLGRLLDSEQWKQTDVRHPTTVATCC